MIHTLSFNDSDFRFWIIDTSIENKAFARAYYCSTPSLWSISHLAIVRIVLNKSQSAEMEAVAPKTIFQKKKKKNLDKQVWAYSL